MTSHASRAFPRSISRRALLRGGLALGASAGVLGDAGLLGRLGQAAAAGPAGGFPDRHYIFCYFGGGWDILLGLDPRDPAIFTNGNTPTTLIQPAYELATAESAPVIDPLRDGSMRLGPYMGELARHASRLCVVRGLNMDTLTHEVGRRRFLTGRPPSGLNARGSSTDSWLTSVVGGEEAIPNLSIGVESYNHDRPTFATALSARGLDDLLRVLGPSAGALPASVEDRIDALIARASGCPEGRRSELLTRAEDARADARAMVRQRLDARFDLRANTPAMQAVRERFGITTSATSLGSANARAALAGLALTGGISRVVSFSPTGGLDTHFDNWQTDHGPRLAEAHTAVARLVDHLLATPYPDGSGDSWLDRTVILGFSEFSRTPLLNAQGGRDHWLLNACFLAGGDIAGGKVVGASSNRGMNPMPVDLLTGQAFAQDAAGMIAAEEVPGVREVIRPEHVLQALYHEIGLRNDSAQQDLRVPPLMAIFR
jgi:uncharacterized protein (DUF1501 family)